MKQLKKAFTMIELIFVIVIIGILASIALPKLTATRDDAKIAIYLSEMGTFIHDIGAYYTSKGTYEANPISLMTRIQFYTDISCTTQATQIQNSKTYYYCTENGMDQEACMSFSPKNTDGNIIINEISPNGSICENIQATTTFKNFLGEIKLGGQNLKF